MILLLKVRFFIKMINTISPALDSQDLKDSELRPSEIIEIGESIIRIPKITASLA